MGLDRSREMGEATRGAGTLALGTKLNTSRVANFESFTAATLITTVESLVGMLLHIKRSLCLPVYSAFAIANGSLQIFLH
jgi:hypothetical protein